MEKKYCTRVLKAQNPLKPLLKKLCLSMEYTQVISS
jgi:hypothetical protein